ncbi:hypothetical protein [Fundidesulfovibrio soli]|uniref:hypothetical protein n=1 Tax=Fundidesulfovibrio soli TaxID=2922716 RepID=UPI001FAF6E74|nr:hypothetical protein [Fundidesulfovibrio soli]
MKRIVPAIVLAALVAAPEAGMAKKKDKDYQGAPPGSVLMEPLPPGQAKKPGGGPPPWAPAHGYRAKQQYRYYPRYNLYQDPATGLFFSFQGGGWIKGGLPGNVPPGHLGKGYMIQGDPDAPYKGNDGHMKKYKVK